MIKRTNPRPPLGQYPQPELYGHAGSAPINSRIRIINRIVLMASPFLNYLRLRGRFWMSTRLALGNMLNLTPAGKKDFLLLDLNFFGYDADCVFVRLKLTTNLRCI